MTIFLNENVFRPKGRPRITLRFILGDGTGLRWVKPQTRRHADPAKAGEASPIEVHFPYQGEE